ncbi:MAG: DUF502 domain-containing protein [Steroidobacteraceae bacterium]
MQSIKTFLKVTLVGGVMFLVPVVLLLVVLGKGLQFANKIAVPLAKLLPVSHLGGVAVTTLLAACVLMLVALLAGIAARTGPGRRVTNWFEESLLGGLPQYRMVKSMAEGLTQIESGEGLVPVLMRGDEGWMLGYQVEVLPDDWRVVFLPASPTPMSGNVIYVEGARVQALSISMREAMVLVKRLGIGSAASLSGVALGASGGARAPV